jgi:hypothetical protein
MPPAKATRKSSTTAAASQPSLKDSFAAVRTAKNAAIGMSTERKKSQTVTPIVVVATPPVEVVAPKPAPKKVLKKRNSTTDEDSEEEDDYEPISPTLESDRDGPHVVENVEVSLQPLMVETVCNKHIMLQVTSHDEGERPQLDVKDKSVNKHLNKVNKKMGYMRGSSLFHSFMDGLT